MCGKTLSHGSISSLTYVRLQNVKMRPEKGTSYSGGKVESCSRERQKRTENRKASLVGVEERTVKYEASNTNTPISHRALLNELRGLDFILQTLQSYKRILSRRAHIVRYQICILERTPVQQTERNGWKVLKRETKESVRNLWQ